ncbi:MAG: VWA domain-containing protein [Snowella sp.]|nr:VWA domain-containing protein [Snowella sp.]
MIINCLSVTPGDLLNSWQKAGLNLVSHLQGGRDVVLAFDLTGSVNFNEEGITRSRQIIEDSLQSGDKVYVIPFASDVNPLNPSNDPFSTPLEFTGKSDDISRIIALLPKTNSNLQNTDIQKAEAFIYKGLAKLNQCRFTENKGIKPQSIVWITDAPLLTPKEISSDVWPETPKNSPFRQAESSQSRDRNKWIEALPLKKRSQKITTNDNKSYELSIVDIEPTVQEFCTPAPGGKQICSVNSYLFHQLWLPGLLLGLGIIISGFAIRYLVSLQKSWKFKIEYPKNLEIPKETKNLKNYKKIYLGGERSPLIDCPGNECRGHLERKGNQLYITATKEGKVYYRNKLITNSIKIESLKRFTLNCPDAQERDFEIVIQVTK